MAELHFEALGKNQHDELRDFHSRFDRELNSVNPKIIDIHSITKESTNHCPELLKDLLDCIPAFPFGEDVIKDTGRGILVIR